MLDVIRSLFFYHDFLRNASAYDTRLVVSPRLAALLLAAEPVESFPRSATEHHCICSSGVLVASDDHLRHDHDERRR